MLVDLHTHTTASDGHIAPPELIARAVAAGIELLAITDHDVADAWERARGVCPPGLALVTGIEFSTAWKGHGIHIVGLNFATDSDAMQTALAHQRQAREARARRIAEKLDKHGFGDALAGATALAGNGAIGRPHFAAWLVAIGAVHTVDQAFRKYLGGNRSGALHEGWAELPELVAWIRAAGGTAVLAHPAKYHLSRTRLDELAGHFRAAGGDAIEVISGMQRPDVTRDLAELARRHGFDMSLGSDFHQPGQAWAALGRMPPPPAGLTAVWERW